MSGTSSTIRAPEIDAAKRDLFIACRNLNSIILLGLRFCSQVTLCPTQKPLERFAEESSTLRPKESRDCFPNGSGLVFRPNEDN